MAFPTSVPIKVLDASNPDFNGDLLGKYWALYVGGDTFRERLDEFIIKREIERRGTSIGIRSYDERKKFASYMNRLGGFVDGSVAQIMKDGVRLEVTGGTPDQEAYWHGLNLNCDGRGNSFAAVVRDLLIDELVSRYAWANVRADKEDPDHMYISRVNPMKVIDWMQDGDTGALTYTKARRQLEYRKSQYEPTKLMRVQWILFDDKELGIYEALFNGRVYVDEAGQPIDKAMLVSSEVSEYGLQMYSVVGKRAQWVVDRVSDTVVLLFNKELDLSFALAEAAYPQLVLTVEERGNVEGIIKSELNMAVLETGDKLEYLRIEPGTFSPLQDNIESLKQAIHETIQTMGRDTASIPQAGRMSGETVREMRSPLDALIASFAWPVYETLTKIVDDIKKFRGEEELVVDIVGLVEQNVSSESNIDELDGGDDNGRRSEDGAGRSAEAQAATEVEEGRG